MQRREAAEVEHRRLIFQVKFTISYFLNKAYITIELSPWSVSSTKEFSAMLRKKKPLRMLTFQLPNNKPRVFR
jgi:hypothetical protein